MEQIPHQQMYILSIFVDGKFLLVQKRRCCVEPPPSMAEATPQMPSDEQKQMTGTLCMK